MGASRFLQPMSAFAQSSRHREASRSRHPGSQYFPVVSTSDLLSFQVLWVSKPLLPPLPRFLTVVPTSTGSFVLSSSGSLGLLGQGSEGCGDKRISRFQTFSILGTGEARLDGISDTLSSWMDTEFSLMDTEFSWMDTESSWTDTEFSSPEARSKSCLLCSWSLQSVEQFSESSFAWFSDSSSDISSPSVSYSPSTSFFF